jgi:hypothetical protein
MWSTLGLEKTKSAILAVQLLIAFCSDVVNTRIGENKITNPFLVYRSHVQYWHRTKQFLKKLEFNPIDNGASKNQIASHLEERGELGDLEGTRRVHELDRGPDGRRARIVMAHWVSTRHHVDRCRPELAGVQVP